MTPETCHLAGGNIAIFAIFQLFVSQSVCTRHPWCILLAAVGWLAYFYDPSSCAGRSLTLCSWQVQPTGKVPGGGARGSVHTGPPG